MAEYYALLTRAVGRLQPNTEGSRREVYVKARNALIQQLKAIQPPLSPSEISKQRLELEEAIRKVEREMAGGASPAGEADISRSAARAMEEALAGTPEPAPPPPRPVAAPRPQPVAPPPAPPPSAPEPVYAAEPEPLPRPVPPTPVRVPEPVVAAAPVARADGPREMPAPRSLRDAIRPAAPVQAVPADEDAFGAAPAAQPSVTRTVVTRSPARQPGQPRPVPYRSANADLADGPVAGGLSDAVAADLAEGGRLSRSERKQQRRDAAAADAPAKPKRGIVGRLVVYLIILVILGGIGYAAYYFRDDIRDLIGGDQTAVETTTPPATTTTTATNTVAATTPTTGNDVRVVGPQPADAGATLVNPVGVAADTGPTQAILYEEGAAGDTTPVLDATIAWRIVNDPAGPIIAATIEVPDRHMSIAFSIQENHNAALAFSHEIDFLVTIDPNYTHPAGGVESISQLAVKTSEDAIGEPLVGVSQSLPPDFFWIELDPTAESQNLNRLRSREWFDLGIVYANGQRAILTFQKGLDGQQVFQEALAAWAAN